MYELYVREAIDDGLADVQAGRSTPQAEVRTRLRELVRRAS
jgi:predicted transcriptional regulator